MEKSRGFERSCRERFDGRKPGALGRRVTERATDPGRDRSDPLQKLRLAGRRPRRRRQRIPVGRIDSPDRDRVPGTFRLDGSGQNHLDSLAPRDQPGHRLVELRAGPDGRRQLLRRGSRIGRDERCAFDADSKRLLERTLKRCVIRLVVEIGDQDRDRSVLDRRGRRRAASHEEHADQQREGQRDARRKQPLADARRNRNQFAGIVERGQRRAERRARLKARVGGPLETPHHERVERLGNRFVDGSCRRQAIFEPLHHRIETILRSGPDAEQHFVHNQSERIDIRAAVNRLAALLLRRHVLERAENGARRGIRDGGGNAEVHDERVGLITGAAGHDVGRFQVPVHDARLVRGGESFGDVPREAQGARKRQLSVAPQYRRQIVAFDVRHRDVLDAIDLAEVMNADDVLVRDLAPEEQLVLEAFFDLG